MKDQGLLVFILATVAMVTEGLICQFPHCDTVKCDPLPEHCSGTIKMGGGYCGCCMACFTYLVEGEPCEVKDVIDAIMYPLTENCAPGLVCDRTNLTCSRSFDPSLG
ncbi:hypothetical protein ACF0H5_012121 [Mactra antiquata]